MTGWLRYKRRNFYEAHKKVKEIIHYQSGTRRSATVGNNFFSSQVAKNSFSFLFDVLFIYQKWTQRQVMVWNFETWPENFHFYCFQS